jgi:hypothetical protein
MNAFFGVRGHVRALIKATCRLVESGVVRAHSKELAIRTYLYFPVTQSFTSHVSAIPPNGPFVIRHSPFFRHSSLVIRHSLNPFAHDQCRGT